MNKKTKENNNLKNIKSLKKGSNPFYTIYIALLSCALSLLLSPTSLANPQGGVVSAGSATISNSGNTVQINQTSDKAVVDWRTYNIDSHETTQYVQPSAKSITLNRIDPNNGASVIAGKLQANGQVWLVNPAGIMFTSTARVDVAGLLATTANITNEDFMAGNYRFVQDPNWNGAVVNNGEITIRDEGIAMLVAPGVENNGVIRANLGKVVLASGTAYTVDFYGDQLINFAANSEVKKPAKDANGRELQSAVSNSGKIYANGGSVLMTARTASGVLDNVINMSGVVEAKTAVQRGGSIILSGGDNGTVRVSGKMIASGKQYGQTGGKIKIVGKKIAIVKRARINVSGDAGGGEVLIGGDYQGKNPKVQNAESTYVGKHVTINANALRNGNGGKVIVWANDNTHFYGSIFARGGSEGGDGGFVETSGKSYLDVNHARVNTLAPKGNTGTWLLDPTNIYIATNLANAQTAGMTGSDSSASTALSGTFAGLGGIQDSLLTTGNLTTALASSNVIVSTNNAGGTGVGNITIVDPFSWSSTNSLTLTAANNIVINAAITTGAAGSSLVLNASGAVTQTAAIGGSGSLVQQGSGTATLSLANTFSGGTSITAGTLSVTHTNGLGTSGAIQVSNNGILNVNLSGNTLANSSALTLSNSADLISSVAASSTDTLNNAITLTAGGTPIITSTNANATLALTSSITNNTAALTLNGAGNITIGGVIGAGAGTLTMSSTGTLTLTAANTYSGTTTINAGNFLLNGANGSATSTTFTINEGGTLTLDNSANNNTNRISDTNALTLNGGEFVFKGSNVAATNASESVGALTLPLGASTVTTFSGTGGTTIVTFSSLSRSAGATVLFRGIGQTNNAAPAAGTANIRFTTAPSTGNGQLVGAGALNSTSAPMMPFAFGDTSTSGVGTDFVTYDTGSNTTGMRLLVAAEYTGALTAGTNVKLTSSVTPGANVAINSLLIATGGTLAFPAANRTITITSGALGSTGGSGVTSDTNAARLIAFAGVEGKIFAINNFTIQSNITNTAASPGLTLSGGGTLTFNTQVKGLSNGSYTINEGTLVGGIANAINNGTSVAILDKGTLDLSTFAESITGLTVYSGLTSGASITGSGALTIGNANILVGSNSTGATGASISAPLTFGGTRTITVNDGAAANDLSISSVISGTGGLTKAGTGTLNLTGLNSYTGVTTVSAGTLSFDTIQSVSGGASSLGAPTTVANGTIALGGTGTLQYTGSGHTSNRVINLTASGGTINASGSGTLTLSGGVTGNTFNLNLTGTGAGIESGVIGTTTGTVTKSGTGTWTLSNGANTYTGITTVNAGQLNASTLANQSSNSSIGTNTLLINGGIFSYTGGTVSVTRNLAVGANGGTLQATTNGATLTLTGTLNPAGAGGGANPLIIDVNPGNITLNPGTITTALSNLTVTGSGTGTLLLSKTGIFTGSTTVTSGSLKIGVANTLPTATTLSVTSSGVFDLNGVAQTVGILVGNGTVTNTGAAATLTDNEANTHIFAGAINGATALTMAGTGTLTLSGTNSTYTGATTISSGTLSIASVANSGANSSIGTGSVASTIALSGSGTLQYTGSGHSSNRVINLTSSGGTIDASGSGALTLSGGITGNTFNLVLTGTGSATQNGVINTTSGTLTKNGTGTWTLSGANSYSGTSSITAGLVIANNNSALGSNTLSIASNSTLQINNGITINNNITSISGTGSASQGALFGNGSGTSIFGGTMTLGAAATIGSGASNTFNLTNTINNGGFLATFDTNTGNISASNTISGAGGLTKSGSGTLTLSSTNSSYAGATTINAGVLSVAALNNTGNNSSIGTGSGTSTIALSGTGTLQYTGAGHSSNRVINLTSSGGTLDASGSGALTLSGGITGNTFNVVLTGTGSATQNGVINTTSGTLTKNGTGSWTLGGANSYSGTSSITEGLLIANNNSALGSNSLSIASNSTLQINNSITINNNITSISGTGSASQGALFGSGNGTSTFGGTMTLSAAATLGSGASNTFNLTNTINNGGFLATFDANTGNISTSNTISGAGGLTKSGSGTLTLSSTNSSYAGATTISAGVLSVSVLDNTGNNSSIGTGSGTSTIALSGTGTLRYTGSGSSSNRVINLTSSGATIDASGSGALTLSGGVTGNTFNLVLTGSGSATQSGVINTTTGTFTKNGTGTWSLGGSNTYSGATSITNGNLTLTNVAALGSSSGTTVSSGANLNINFSSGNTLSNTNTITLNGTGSGTGALTLSSANITLNNPIALASTSTIGGTGTGTVTLGGNITGTAVNLTINLPNAGLSLPSTTLTTSGNLSVTTNGAITQTGALTIPGTSSFSAGANSITLTNTSNSLTGPVTLSNSSTNDVSLTNSIALQIAGATIGRDLNLTAGGSITQSGVINSSNGTLTAIVTAATSDILLQTQANNLGAGGLVFGGTAGNKANIRDVGIRNTSSSASLPSFSGLTNIRNLTIQFDNAGITFPSITLTNSGSLTAITGGAIQQSARIIVPGSASFSAGANSITLLNSSNNVDGGVSFITTGANDVSYRNNSALQLNTSSVGGNLSITAVNAISQLGALTVSGTSSFTTSGTLDTITLTNAGNHFVGAVSLQNAGTANDVSITNDTALILGSSSISGNFNVIAGGSISQTGAIDAGNGIVTLTVNASNSDILLDTQDNNLGILPLVFSGTLTNIRDFGIQNNNSAAILPSFTGLTNLRSVSLIFTGTKIILPALTLNSGGNLTVSARGVTGGAITQIGALVVPGTSSFSSTLGTSAQRSITLTNSGNQFTGAVSLTTNGTGDVSIVNSLALSLANSSLGTGDLTLNGVGISQVGGSSITQLSGAGAVTLTANTGVINLSNSNNDFTGIVSATNSAANAVSLTDASALSVGNFTLTGASNLTLNAVGITQASSTTINSGSGTISINGGGGALNFGSGTIITTNNTASALSIVNGTTLSLGTTNISSGTVTLGAGDITGAVTQSGATILTANNLTANTTSNITLSNNNVIPNLGVITAGGSFTFNDNSALVLNNAISASTAVSPLSITATGLLTISGNITSSTGSNGISLTGAGITQSGSITVNAGTGALTYNAGTGTITTNASSLLLSTGTINLIANNMVFNSAGQIGGTGAGAGTAATTILRQSTNGTAINIENGAAALSLTQTELNTIRSTNVRIGDSNSGLITIGAWTPAATFAPNLLTLQTGSSGITTTGAIILGANSNLLIRSGGSVSLTNSNVFTNIAASLSSGSFSVTNAATNPIVVASLTDDVGAVNGVTAPGGVTINTSGSGGSISVNQNISTTNTAVTLNGIGITQAGSTTIDSGSGAISLNAGTGSLGLNASSIVLTTGILTLNADSMAFNASSQLGGSGVGAGRAAIIIITPNTAGTTVGLAGGAGSLNLDANELATLRGTNIRIGNSNTGAMTIASSTWTPGANFAPTSLTLFANGITQGAGINLATSTSDLIIRGAGTVTLNNSNNVFDNIAATKSSGSFSVTNATTNPLTVTSLTDDIGTVTGITTPANISLSSSGTGGLLTLSAAVTSTDNVISLTGQGVSLLGSVTVNSGAAALTVNAGNGNLDLNANSLLLSTATITLTADTMSFATSSQIGGSGVGTGSATNAILQPSTAATTIGLAGASGTLNLADSELDDVFAQKVRIGNSTAGALVTAAYIPAANFATNTLTLDTGSSITQTGKLDLSTSGSSLLLRDANSVVLDNTSNIFSSVAANIAGPLTIVNQSTNPLSIVSLSDDIGTVNGITASGAVNITASGSGGSLTLNQGITSNNGNIVLSGVGVTQAASTTVNSGSGTIAINGGGAAIQFNTGTLSSTNTGASAITISNGTTIALGNINSSGGLSVTSNGAITDNGVSIISGAATFDAGATTNNITLDSSNDFNSIAITQANNVIVNDINAIALDASTISGTFAVVTSGNITQNGALTVTGATTLTANGATSDITLNSANDFSSIGFAAARNVSVTDANALALNASTISGTLDVVSSGNITQNAALTVTGATTLTANGATSDITLNSSNNFSSIGFAAARNVSVTDANVLVLNASTISGTLAIVTSGNITQNAALTVTGATTLTANGATSDITLNSANDFSSIGFAAARNVSVTDTNGLVLNASTISGTLDVTTGGQLSQTAALDVTGNATFTATGTNTDILLASAANTFGGAVTFANSGGTIRDIEFRNISATAAFPTLPTGLRNLTIIFNNAAINLPAITLSGNLAVTAGGAITDSGALIIAGTSTFAAGSSNNITLDTATNNFASVGITSSNNVILVDANALALNTSTISGTLAVTTSGNITQNGALTVSGATTLTANSATSDITLNNASNDFSSIGFAAARNVSVTDANALALNASTISGTLAVLTSGSITQNAALTVTGATTLTANGATSDITLNNSSNDFSSIGFATARNVSVTDANALALNASTISGTLAVVTSGNITQNAALTVTGATTLTANGATSDITLNSSNDFSSIGFAAARNVSVTDANALALNASTISGTLAVLTSGSITQNAALTVTGATTLTANGATSDITLNNSSNDFSSIGFAAARNVSVTDANALVLNASTISGTLAVVTSGNITQNAALTVTGATTLTANGATSDITLNSSNDFSSIGFAAARNVSVTDANALALNASTISGTFAVVTSGNITQNGALTVTGATTLTANGATSDITLNSANDFSSIGFTAARNVSVTDSNALVLNASTISGTLDVTTGGQLSQTAALDVTGNATFTATAADTDILLASAANIFSGSVTFANSGGTIQDIEFRNISATAAFPTLPTGLRNLTIIFNNAAINLPAITLSGNLSVTAGGAITDSGALIIAGTSTFAAGSSNNITLDTATNNFASVGITSANNVTIVDANALALNTSTISGTLAVTTSGNITQNGALTVSGATTLTTNGATSDITLNNASNDFSSIGFAAARNVSVTDANALALNASTISGTLAVLTSGSITQNAALTVTGATTLTANGATSDITLNNSSNDFSSIGFAAARNVSVSDANALALNASTISGTLAVTTSGNITQNAALTVTGATTLTANGATSDITLNSANDFSSIGFVAARNVSVTDVNDLALNASTVSGTFDITTGGHITQNGALDITGAATFTVSAANSDILLASAANTFSSTSFATTGAGTVRDLALRNIAPTATIPALPAGLRDLTLIFNNAAIDLPSTSLTGNLSVTAGGAITDSGTLVVAGTSTFAAGSSNNITLDTATNNFASVGIISGNNVILVDVNALALNTSTISGALSVTTSGNITQNDALTVTGATTLTANGATSDITLNSANDFSSIGFTAARNVSVTDSNALVLNASTISGTFDVTTDGQLSQTAALDVTGNATFTATGTNTDILLASAANTFSGAVTFANSGGTIRDIEFRNISATAAFPTLPTGLRNLTIIFNNAAINLPAITLSGNLSVTAGGAITDSGALIIAGTSTFAAGSANNITLDTATNNFASVGITSGNNVTLVDVNALALNTSTISGTLAVTTSGNITQNGALTVTGATTLTANGATSDITLNSTNNFSSIGFAAARNVSVTDANALALNASTISGTLDVVTSGSITQTAALTVTGATTLAANGATSDITLNSANDFSSIGFTAARNVSVTDASALVLNASTISGTLAVITSGNITQNGALSVTGATTLTANGVTSDITLNNSSNDFSSIGFAAARNVSVTDANALALNTSTISGTLAVVTSGNITQNAALTVTGATTLTANGATSDITLNSANDFSSIGFAAAGNVSVTDTNGLVLNASTISGTFDVTTGGQLSQTAALDVTGNATFTATGTNTDILLASAANTFGGAVTFANSGGTIRDIEFRNISATAAFPTLPTGLRNLTIIFNNAAINLPAITLSGNLSVTAGGAITDSGALIIAGTSTFAAGSSNNITLDTATNNFASVGITSGNNVTLVDVNALVLNTSTISGTLAVTTSDNITQNGALTVTGATTLTANGATSDITLNNSSNDFSSIGFAAARNVSVTDANALALNASTISGTLAVVTSGNITQTAALTVTGATTLAANGATSDITLNSANDFSSIGFTTARNVSVTDANALALNASTVSGTFDITAGGHITQNGALDIIGAATFTVSAANSDILLASAANTFSSTSFATSGAGTVRDLALRNIATSATIPALPAGLRDLTLIFDNAAIDLPSTSLTGNLSVTAGGAITDSGTLVVAGTSTFAAGASNNITLDTATNNFASVGITSGNNVILVDANALALNTSTVSGTLAVTTSGNITQNGALTVTGATTLTANGATSDITLNSANDFSSIGFAAARNVSVTDANALALNASTISGTLAVVTSGSITQNAALTVTGATTLTANGATSDITLNSANDFSSIGFATARNVSVTDANALALNASTISGTLALVTSSNITQNAALTVTGATTLTANGATSDITLNSANDFSSIGFAAAHNVSVTDANALALNASTVSGTFDITAGGHITQNGALDITGAATFTVSAANSDILLASAANTFSSTSFATSGAGIVRDLALRNIAPTATIPALPAGLRDLTLIFNNAAIDLPSTSLTGNLSVTAGGAITDSGTLVVAGTSTFAAGSANNITLDAATNNFASVGITSGNNVTLVDVNALIIASSTVSGNLNITTNGAITNSGNITVAGSATFAAGLTNDITLNSSGNDFNSLTITSANIATIVDVNALSLTSAISNALSVTATGNLTTGSITSNGGNINLITLTPDTSARILTINGNITSNGGSVIANAANPNNITALIVNGIINTVGGSGQGTLTVGGGVALNASPILGSGDITLQGNGLDLTLGNLNFNFPIEFAVNRYIVINGALTTSGPTSNLTLTGDQANTGLGGIFISSTGSLNSAGNLTLIGSSLNGLTGANPNAAIEIQSGASINANGALTLQGNLGNGNIIINSSMQSHGDMTITPAGTGNIQIGASSLASNGGAMTFSSPIVLSNNLSLESTNGNMMLNGLSGTFNLALDSGSAGNITFNNTTNINNMTIVNTNDFTNNGTITVTNYQQNAGNTANLGTSTLIVNNGFASITSNNILGRVVVNNGNFTGNSTNLNITLNVSNGNATINSTNVNSNLTTTGTTTITGYSVFGIVNVGGLTLNVTGPINLSGSVGGSTGAAAVAKINFVIPPMGLQFFDGIDLGFARFASSQLVARIVDVINPNNVQNVFPAFIEKQTGTNLAATSGALISIVGTGINTSQASAAISRAVTASSMPASSYFRSGLPKVWGTSSGSAPYGLGAGGSNAALAGSRLFGLARGLAAAPEAIGIGYGILASLAALLAGLSEAIRRFFDKTKYVAQDRFIEFSFNIRTELNNILSAAGLIYNEKLCKISASQKEFFNDIVISSNQMNDYLERLEQANKLPITSLSKVSFDLRTFLEGINGFTELMKNGKAGPVAAELKEYLNDILDSAHSILGMIKDISHRANKDTKLFRQKESALKYIGGASFMLRTHLTNINGYAEVMQNNIYGVATPMQKELLNEIIASVQHAQTVLAHFEQTKPDRHFVKELAFKLRTALNGMILSAQLMQDGKTGPVSQENKECVEYILAESKTILRFLNNPLLQVDAPKELVLTIINFY